MKLCRHRGLALPMSLMLTALVGAALATATLLMQRQARQTFDARTEAQLRQLLLAATLRLPQPPHALDPVLTEQGYSLHVIFDQTDSAEDRTIEVEASCSGRVLRQTVRLRRQGERWKVVDAQLHPSAGIKPAAEMSPHPATDRVPNAAGR